MCSYIVSTPGTKEYMATSSPVFSRFSRFLFFEIHVQIIVLLYWNLHLIVRTLFYPLHFNSTTEKRTSVSPPPFYRNEKAASTTFDCHCKCMESWERTNNHFFFVADIQCVCRFPKSTKRPINVQRTWFTPHALFTHYDPWLGIPYYNLTPPVPHEEDTPYYSPPQWGRAVQLCGFLSWEPSSVHSGFI